MERLTWILRRGGTRVFETMALVLVAAALFVLLCYGVGLLHWSPQPSLPLL